MELNHLACKKNRAAFALDADFRLHLAAVVARPEPRLYLSRLVGQCHRPGNGDARVRGGYDCIGLRYSIDHDRFSVDNPYVLAHECHPIEAIMNNEGTSGERAKEVILTLLGFNELMTVATIPIPAPPNCGDGTTAESTGGKFSVTQANYGTMQVRPTIEEWNRLNPETPMLR